MGDAVGQGLESRPASQFTVTFRAEVGRRPTGLDFPDSHIEKRQYDVPPGQLASPRLEASLSSRLGEPHLASSGSSSARRAVAASQFDSVGPVPDEFMTVYEVAELLKLNQQTVRNWIDRGELRAIRVGPRRIRVLRSDLDAFIAGSTTAGPSRHEAEVTQVEEVNTAEELARLRLQLDSAAAEEDPARLAQALTEIAESARGLADRMKGTAT